MSYDLLVFDPVSVPTGHGAFLDWYDQQTQWTEGHSYDDPARCVPALRDWYMEMVARFPPMSGPFAGQGTALSGSTYVTDYCVGQHIIYCGFASSVSMGAYDATFGLAKKHRVGFFDVSGDGMIWTPPAA